MNVEDTEDESLQPETRSKAHRLMHKILNMLKMLPKLRISYNLITSHIISNTNHIPHPHPQEFRHRIAPEAGSSWSGVPWYALVLDAAAKVAIKPEIFGAIKQTLVFVSDPFVFLC